MKQFNTYYYGEDLSHCGSCWERDDETTYTLITPLTLEEMKDKFEKYCWGLTSGWDSYQCFLMWLADSSEDIEDNLIFPTIYFEMKGTSYAPDMRGSQHTGVDYDVETFLKKEDIKDWKKLEKMWEEGWKKEQVRKKKREEIPEKEIKRKEKNTERQRKYRAKKKEFEDYQKLKEKWEGKKEPDEPKLIEKKKPKLETLKNLMDLVSF